MTPQGSGFELFVQALGTVGRLAAGVLRGVFMLWLRLPPRARLVSAIAILVVLSASSAPASASLAATFQGLAVLLVAFVGLGTIMRAPFRRRRR